MKKLSFLFLILLPACVSSYVSFDSLPKANDTRYGYTINEPIRIGMYESWQRNAEVAYYMLSKFKYNGTPLKFVMHTSIAKPEDQPRSNKSIVPYRYAYSGSLGGEILEMYVMVPKGTTDTLKLYFDVEVAGDIQMPLGMEIDQMQKNNIYR